VRRVQGILKLPRSLEHALTVGCDILIEYPLCAVEIRLVAAACWVELAQFDELSSAVTTTMPARMMVAVIMVAVLSWF
jgi:hypothetical protein